ncbi:MAG: hypothetical protein DRI40_03225 [Chloroflexi bacterium]|nr:MAG: hypothetical protein DRI40_03225 [Chloroflexota bacterium]
MVNYGMLAASRPLDISLDRRQVLKSLGYRSDSEPSPRIASLVDEYIENARQLLEPRHAYAITNVEWVHDSVAIVGGSTIFQSRVIARLLERCSMVAVFLVTIGNRLEETACRLAEDGLILQSYVLDAIGSEAVEEVAQYVEDMTRETARADGLVIGKRVSPGYCDWDISQQNEIFKMLDATSLGVQLTDQCLMVPQKSISGIIGIGPPEGKVDEYNPCKTCTRQNCLGRR